MNKESFLRRLRELLSGILSAEAEEALEYYRDYFEDAGVENEARVMEELGSPEKVAANILHDLGYPEDVRTERTDPVREPVFAQEKEKSHSMGWIIAAIATCWLWGPLLIGLVSVLFAFSIALISLVFAVGVAAVCVMIAAVVLLGVGILKLFISPAGGLILLGVGMILAGISIYGVLLAVLIFGKAIPAIFRGIAMLWHKLFGKGGSVA